MIRSALNHAFRNGEALRFTPPPPVSAQMAECLIERYGDRDRPLKSPEQLQALLQRLHAAGFAWSKVSGRDRVDIVWVLWQGQDPPAEHEAFLESFLGWVERPWRQVQARRLASSWAEAFEHGCNSVRKVGAWLKAHAPRLGDPWSGLAEKLDIFSPHRGPANLAQAYLGSVETAPAFWERLRLPPRARSGGFLLASLGAAASLAQPKLARDPGLVAHLIDFALDDGVFRADAAAAGIGARLAAAVRAQLAEALLSPWQDAAPPDAVKETIIGFLTRHYEDPRVKREVWQAVTPEAAKIWRGWLNREAIVAFFRLAAKTKEAQKLPWRARQKFWLAAGDWLDDAWLILGPQSGGVLKSGDRGSGRLVGCAPEHCALLLKLRGMTIVESSHAEHERVWLSGNERAPLRTYGPTHSYTPAALTNGADFSSSYAVHDGGVWHKGLCDFIARHTGIMLAAAEGV